MRRALAIVTMTLVVLAPRLSRAAEVVKVLVPDRGNLQFTSFWVADAAGYFAEEGMQLEIVTPPGPPQAEAFFEAHAADVAVLPPPVYASLIAHGVPVVLVANLLANDPINLVVRRSVMEARGLRADMPLKARLEGLRGLKLGVAPHPPTRLRLLYSSVGLDADKDITQVVLHGKEQNEAFREQEVDALYAHTPYLERALLHDDAVMLVNQSAGEVPGLARRQIHALTVRRSFLELHEPMVRSLVRAIAKAEVLARTKPDAICVHLAKAFPQRDRAEIDLIARLYAPAIPETPTVHADLIPNAVELFPAEKARPDLSKVDLHAHVFVIAPPVADQAPLTEQRWFQILGAAVGGLVFVVTSALMRARLTRRDVPPDVRG